MSSGHFHASYKAPEIARKVLQRAMSFKAVKTFLNSKFRVDHTYDIPYLGGYSTSGLVIYIDRHTPLNIMIRGKGCNIMPFIITHERTEKALIDHMDMDYDEAHKIATYAEHEHLVDRGFSPHAYELALDPYIKADQHEKIIRVPKDLDLKPYRDSKDTKLISRMKLRMV